MITPFIKTKKLILRPLSILDAEEVFLGWSGDPEATRFLEWDRHRNVMSAIKWLSALENAVLSDRNYTWGIVQEGTGELVGTCGIVYKPEEAMFELGYVLDKRHWGQGIASEAVEELTRFAKEKLGLTALYAKCAKENPASRRVLEKAGFVYQREGTYSKHSGNISFECSDYILKMGDAKA